MTDMPAAGETATASQPVEVSIALLCFRDRPFIEQAIDAALAQTVPCEIVISNDASDDGTYEAALARVQGYRGPHSVTVRRNERNLGVSGHVNAVVPLTRGRVIVMMAGDDVSAPDRVARILEAFERHPDVTAVASDFQAIDAHGAPVEIPFHQRRQHFGLEYFVEAGRLIGLLGATLAFRREVFDRFGALQGPIEDNALSLRAALLGNCLNLKDRLIQYRQHDGSVSAGVFARAEPVAVAKRRRYERTIRFYRGTADDLAACVAQMPDLSPERRRLAMDILAMYRIEADAREALLNAPRRAWVKPIVRGLLQRGLRRKSAERLLKLVVPRAFLRLGA